MPQLKIPLQMFDSTSNFRINFVGKGLRQGLIL